MEPIDTFVFIYIFILLFMISLFITNNITKHSLHDTLTALTYLMTYHWGVYVQSSIGQLSECECDCDK